MVWITFCQKVFYFSGPVFCRALFPYAYITPSRQWFHENEDTAGSFSDIFGIRLLYVAGAHRQRLQMIIQHLVWLFVHADHRHFRIIWLFVYIEDIFHVHYKIRVFLWRDTPVFIHVGTEFVFFKTRRIVSRPTGSSSSRRTCFSRRRSVHRHLPSGAGPQAIRIISASTLPSAFLRAFEFGLRLIAVTALTPPSAYAFTIFETVALLTPYDFAICSWVR